MPFQTAAVPGVALPGTVLPGQPLTTGIAHPGVAALSGTGSLASAGTRAVNALAPLSGAGALTANGGKFVTGAAALSAAPAVTVNASVQTDLWAAYLKARYYADAKWLNWRMMRQAGGTDGTAGFLYGTAYEAENAADAAYAAWQAGQRVLHPGVTG